jgi:hypothetical protein
MLKFERHLVVVTIIAVVIIAASVLAILLEVPLPIVGRD